MGIPYRKRSGLTPEQKAAGVSIVQSFMKFKLTEEEFITQMMQRNPKYTAGDIRSVLDTTSEVLWTYLSNGVGVSVPGVADFKPALGGTTKPNGEWITGPFKNVNVQVAKSILSKFQEHAVLQPLPSTHIRPVIDQVKDSQTGSINSLLTRGKSASVDGAYLKFHPLLEDEGIFLVAEDGVAVKATGFLDNLPARLTFDVPEALEVGAMYILEVRARHRKAKTLYSSEFMTLLTIV